MLHEFRDLGFFRKAPLFPRIGPGLYSLLGGAGHSRETDSSYDWHGLKRGDGRFALFQYTLEGEGALRYETREMRVGPGEAMLLPVPQDHRYGLPKDSANWDFIFIILQGRESHRIAQELARRRGPVLKLAPDSRPIRTAIDICCAVRDGQIKDCYDSSMWAYRLLMELASEIMPAVGQRDTPDFIARIITFCEKNYHLSIGVDDLTTESNYSRYHFSRVFKKWMGLSPGEYLQAVRLNHARSLLGETTLTVKEIAYRVGFGDHNYFCRAFRKQVGQSPGNFRKSGLVRGSR